MVKNAYNATLCHINLLLLGCQNVDIFFGVIDSLRTLVPVHNILCHLSTIT